eukprot:CAMPEP_0205884344 /NCGR_PEP_ID=MMETSP1083-20121108/18060_1 /ASSEMBLY_ACC=CAM_ASM_000430 /TAXON_ID=97485 /ORGANISM="Prymnesium parvum, Strain Texoma1" /LENGTH=37 /DNA_ID= /DNA_START= /DNA_END= /DNA_ORIENTATION=
MQAVVSCDANLERRTWLGGSIDTTGKLSGRGGRSPGR